MADILSKEKRSWNMSQIKASNTKPEILVRKILHNAGFRFRLQNKSLPGKPDIVLPKYKSIIFVHGCFWHRHKGCKFAYNPKSRIEFWQKKFNRNIERDKEHSEKLQKMGWTVYVIWECELKDNQNINKIINSLHSAFQKQ